MTATLNQRDLGQRAMAAETAAYPPEINEDDPRPATYGGCMERGLGTHISCPYVSCRWSLYLDVHPTSGSIKLNFPDLEPDELRETCALAVANRGGDVLDAVGATMNITRERIRQLVSRALTKLARALGEAHGLDGRTAPMPKGSVADRAALVQRGWCRGRNG